MSITNISSNQSLGLSNTVAMSNARPGAAVLVPLFSSTLFVSAFLMFLIQPMVAKMVLPLLGGSPMVWNTCIVFFQVALLAGYAYAHAATKWLHGQLQVLLHLMLLVLPFAVLPFLIGRESAARAEGTPIAWLLMLLAGSIGLPFFVLATSASILQHWFSRTDHHSAGDPYFLYMSSNIGSFVALATYPALVEPLLSLRDQSRIWTAGYGLFAALVAGCALFAWRGRHLSATQFIASTTSQADIPPLTVRSRALWVALAFVPSSLMLAVTTYLSTDIAAVPLLWILPLGLYLLTFIAAFSSKGRSAQGVARRLFPLLLIPLVLVLCTRVTGSVTLLFPLHVLTFVAAAFLCHTRLAEQRPSPAHLTEFYLWISFGGMLGGLFNGLAAPLLFSRVLEYPIVLVLACIVLPGVPPRRAQPTASRRRELVLDLAIPAMIAAMTVVAAKFAAPFAMVQVAMAIPALLAFAVRRRPFRFAMSIGALLVAALAVTRGQAVLHAERTFFGVYRVSQDRKGEYRALAHGTTLHGMQAISGPEHDKPLTYYHRSGPFGQAFAGLSRSRRLENIAVIGLGVGVLGTYAQPGQQWTFYEIDEAIERMARDTRYFDYLERCGDRCRVVIGDARLSLARASVSDYDLLVLDAFSSDSIPMHLLTSEALALYLKHLRPDGLLLFHISNRHLALAPIIGRLAEQYSLITVMNFDRRGRDWPASRSESIWVAMARTLDDLGAIGTDRRWSAIDIPSSTPLWTDDFSNILSALQFR